MLGKVKKEPAATNGAAAFTMMSYLVFVHGSKAEDTNLYKGLAKYWNQHSPEGPKEFTPATPTQIPPVQQHGVKSKAKMAYQAIVTAALTTIPEVNRWHHSAVTKLFAKMYGKTMQICPGRWGSSRPWRALA